MRLYLLQLGFLTRSSRLIPLCGVFTLWGAHSSTFTRSSPFLTVFNDRALLFTLIHCLEISNVRVMR